jgi:hypothetical protein
MNFTGIFVGAVLLLAIGLGHVWVIRLEYHVGAHIWRVVLGIGVVLAAASLLSPSFKVSAYMGIIAGSIIWGASELPAQEARVRRGVFPSNPKRVDLGARRES